MCTQEVGRLRGSWYGIAIPRHRLLRNRPRLGQGPKMGRRMVSLQVGLSRTSSVRVCVGWTTSEARRVLGSLHPTRLRWQLGSGEIWGPGRKNVSGLLLVPRMQIRYLNRNWFKTLVLSNVRATRRVPYVPLIGGTRGIIPHWIHLGRKYASLIWRINCSRICRIHSELG